MLSISEQRDKIRADFLSMGFYVGDGLKYGVDFLLYTDAPDRVHSRYAVLVQQSYLDLIGISVPVLGPRRRQLLLYMADQDLRRGDQIMVVSEIVKSHTVLGRDYLIVMEVLIIAMRSHLMLIRECSVVMEDHPIPVKNINSLSSCDISPMSDYITQVIPMPPNLSLWQQAKQMYEAQRVKQYTTFISVFLLCFNGGIFMIVI